MKQLTEYRRVSAYLDKIFNKLNATYFESELSKPVITIQSTPRAYGHVSVAEVWTSGEANHRHELNIGAGTLNRPIENVVATMLHEMVHLYNLAHGVQDCSRGGSYHNKKFRDEAIKRDLQIDHHPTYGWTLTTPTDNLVQWCIDNDLEEISVYRHDGACPIGITPPPRTGDLAPTAPGTTRPKSSTRRYVCPRCKAIARTTRDMKIICGECYDPKHPENIPYMEQG